MGRPRRPTGSFWPSPTQELLLRAALNQPEGALAAWRELGPAFELRTLESGSIAALPLVYANLKQTVPDDARLPHLKGVVRNCWARNRLLGEQLAAVLQGFESAGVTTVLLDSLAAAVSYYDRLDMRPTTALDFLIDQPTLTVAMRSLGRLGFSASQPPGPDQQGPLMLTNRQGQIAVLRTTAAVELTLGLEELLESSRTVEIGSCTVRAASPVHDLLTVCTAGARVKPVRTIQWLIDAARISAVAMSDAQWDRLCQLAEMQGQMLRLRESLAYLNEILEVPLPPRPGWRDELRNAPRRERIAYRCAGASVPGLGSLPQAIGEHLTATRGKSGWRTLQSFPDFLQRRWNLDRRWQIFAAAAQRAAAALTRRERSA